MWLVPLLLIVVLLNYTLTQWKSRVSDYLRFVKGSPGPGMLTNRSEYRQLDPKAATTSPPAVTPAVVSGDELQKKVREELEKSEKEWNKWQPWIKVISILIIIVLIILLIAKRWVFA
jgi:hypothetical protein